MDDALMEMDEILMDNTLLMTLTTDETHERDHLLHLRRCQFNNHGRLLFQVFSVIHYRCCQLRHLVAGTLSLSHISNEGRNLQQNENNISKDKTKTSVSLNLARFWPTFYIYDESFTILSPENMSSKLSLSLSQVTKNTKLTCFW